MSENIKILKKLHSIMSEVPFIEKDKRNEHQRYKYASEQAIKMAIQPLLVKHKVLFTVQGIEIERSGEITTGKFIGSFIDVESGERIDLTLYAEGWDKQDKSYYKCITGAIKYILTSTFLIPTGDDAEAVGNANTNANPAPTKPKTKTHQDKIEQVMDKIEEVRASRDDTISEAQRRRLFAIHKKHNWPEGAVKDLIYRWGYSGTDKIKRKHYEAIVDCIEKDRAPSEEELA